MEVAGQGSPSGLASASSGRCPRQDGAGAGRERWQRWRRHGRRPLPARLGRPSRGLAQPRSGHLARRRRPPVAITAYPRSTDPPASATGPHRPALSRRRPYHRCVARFWSQDPRGLPHVSSSRPMPIPRRSSPSISRPVSMPGPVTPMIPVSVPTPRSRSPFPRLGLAPAAPPGHRRASRGGHRYPAGGLRPRRRASVPCSEQSVFAEQMISSP